MLTHIDNIERASKYRYPSPLQVADGSALHTTEAVDSEQHVEAEDRPTPCVQGRSGNAHPTSMPRAQTA